MTGEDRGNASRFHVPLLKAWPSDQVQEQLDVGGEHDVNGGDVFPGTVEEFSVTISVKGRHERVGKLGVGRCIAASFSLERGDIEDHLHCQVNSI